MSRAIASGLTALLLCGAASAGTTLYKWVDAQGVVHYSDSPQPGAQKVDIQPVQTYKAQPAPPSGASAGSSGGYSSSGSSGAGSSGASAAAYSCSITAPQTDEAFFAPQSVAVAVAVTPGLQEGDQLQILYDGTAVSSSADPQASIQQPARGSHSVGALIRGPDGRVRCNAAPVTFNVQRPSTLSPQSPQAGTPGRVHP
jgi:hypothetical protein